MDVRQLYEAVISGLEQYRYHGQAYSKAPSFYVVFDIESVGYDFVRDNQVAKDKDKAGYQKKNPCQEGVLGTQLFGLLLIALLPACYFLQLLLTTVLEGELEIQGVLNQLLLLQGLVLYQSSFFQVFFYLLELQTRIFNFFFKHLGLHLLGERPFIGVFGKLVIACPKAFLIGLVRYLKAKRFHQVGLLQGALPVAVVE